MMEHPDMLCFGPQLARATPIIVEELRSALRTTGHTDAWLRAVDSLRQVWTDLTAFDASLQTVAGPQAIADLASCISKDGDAAEVAQASPANVFSMPLTVLVHVSCYLDAFRDVPHHAVLSETASAGVQGLCVGLLSALAVSSARDRAQVLEEAAVALRLAFVIGAYIDLDAGCGSDASPSVSLAVRWRAPTTIDHIVEMINDYPSAYLSVVRDASDINVTVAESDADSITAAFKAENISVKSTELLGRCHMTSHSASLFKRASEFVSRQQTLQIGQAATLCAVVRSNSDGKPIESGNLTDIALRCILLETAQWLETCTASVEQLARGKRPVVAAFGPISFVPPSLVRLLGLKIWRLPKTDSKSESDGQASRKAESPSGIGDYADNAIAVVGMACRFPGANTVEDFWDIIHGGRSMAERLPSERFVDRGSQRGAAKSYWGNFIDDVDAFDHRFFKKSAREASSTDPQQRILLEVAYHALESSGYFGDIATGVANDIGCYVGVCSSDYNDNIATHPPTAYSTLGSLRAFLSGKISHQFGFTGPSVTFDTACSSSAVAINAACQAIQSGQCSQALAGGVSLYTSPYFYQNLTAGGFLSPTGQTKPFDAAADGYCRGEGLGLVMLKRLSSAVADNDKILGVIGGSAVNQNRNCTAITVPEIESQVSLYQKAMALAGVHPNQVTFVEAHGTGTKVGDPIELESIRRAFGSANRTEKLTVASVKGNVGHLEGASGVAALIKVLLMLQARVIPMQASHSSLNPNIPALEPDNMQIITENRPWQPSSRRIACCNNYGAAGSNATMVVLEAPSSQHGRQAASSVPDTQSSWPVCLYAASEQSLQNISQTMLDFVAKQRRVINNDQELLASIAFGLARKENHELSVSKTGIVSDLDQFCQLLSSKTVSPTPEKAKRPSLVLAFGGQSDNVVQISKTFYESADIFRQHLDCCDNMLKSMKLPSIYPELFEGKPLDDVVKLHAMLFSVQYASAKAWMDSGARPKAIIGHSFGELTALVIAGVLSLQDGLRLVAGRAALIQSHWGSDPGSMISIEADGDTTRALIQELRSKANLELEVACVNGPTAHVLVGSKEAVLAMEDLLRQGTLRFKTLNVTHGFHSRLTEPILPGLEEVSKQLRFNEEVIPLYKCSLDGHDSSVTPLTIINHSRQTVHFGDSVARITADLGPCFWLEAGSSSPVMSMIRRALDHTNTKASHTFQSTAWTGTSAWSNLCNATKNLWEKGLPAHFWPLHRSQSASYTPLSLPLYKFERTKHWLDWSPPTAPEQPAIKAAKAEAPVARVRTLLSFANENDRAKDSSHVDFAIDCESDEWIAFVTGHAVLDVPLCPAPLYVELITRAISLLDQSKDSLKPVVSIEKLVINHPLGCIPGRQVRLRLTRQRSSQTDRVWDFEFSGANPGSKTWDSHSLGRASASTTDVPQNSQGLRRYQRLLGTSRLEVLRQDPDSEVIQGTFLYKSFARVVSYADYYKGVKSVRSRALEVAGLVKLPPVSGDTQKLLEKTLTNPLAVDNFIQVAGVHANLLAPCPATDVFVCTNVDEVRPTREFMDLQAASRTFEVFATSEIINDRKVAYDIYVYDTETNQIVFVVLGALFTRINMKSLTRILKSANQTDGEPAAGQQRSISTKAPQAPELEEAPFYPDLLKQRGPDVSKVATSKPHRSKLPAAHGTDIGEELRALLERVTDIPAKDFVDSADFEQIGVDSLMITDVLSEICLHFKCDISMDTFATLTDMRKLIRHLESITDLSGNDSSSSAEATDSGDDISDTTDNSSLSDGSPKTPAGYDMESLSRLVCEHLEIESIAPKENLANHGLDSLLCIELANDIQKLFDVQCNMERLDNDSTMLDLWNLVLDSDTTGRVKKDKPEALSQVKIAQTPSVATEQKVNPATLEPASNLTNSKDVFASIRAGYDTYAGPAGFSGFWDNVYPLQSRLVQAYVLEAFGELGCDVQSIESGSPMPRLQFSPVHTKLMPQLHEILVESGLLRRESDGTYSRTRAAWSEGHSSALLSKIIKKFPQHENEHRLLHSVGEKLGGILQGKVDPVRLLFASKDNRQLLEDVYARGPMYEAISNLLCSFMVKAFGDADGVVHILELGAGTGGTTRHVTKALDTAGIAYTYTFTDISGSLVNAAKNKKFSGRDNFEFTTLDIEKEPEQRFRGRYHMVLSTNCIHATRNLANSTTNILKLLRPEGFCSVVEFTRNIFWFDIVFGVLDGWWLFNDGRKHVLASEWFWKNAMDTAGFASVDWTEGPSEESKTLRIITAFNSGTGQVKASRAASNSITTVWKEVDGKSLEADVYLPRDTRPGKRPVALLLHGGGHCLLTRKDVNRRQVEILLEKGFLPVSVDYRLCPETTIVDGPMTDSRDALRWAREELPHLDLTRPGLTVDSRKVAVVGWSAGGTLAMSLAFTALEHDMAPPDAILAFYCPTDFEDAWWRTPCFPKEIQGSPNDDLDFLEAVQDDALSGYKPQFDSQGGATRWSTKDARWRIISHMNWNAQHLPVLLNGLPGPTARSKSGMPSEQVYKTLVAQPQPSADKVRSISPLAQISVGKYKVPTVLVHGSGDDLIPWQQTQRTGDALSRQGVASETIIIDDAEHLFDAISSRYDPAVLRAFEKLSSYAFAEP